MTAHQRLLSLTTVTTFARVTIALFCLLASSLLPKNIQINAFQTRPSTLRGIGRGIDHGATTASGQLRLMQQQRQKKNLIPSGISLRLRAAKNYVNNNSTDIYTSINDEVDDDDPDEEDEDENDDGVRQQRFMLESLVELEEFEFESLQKTSETPSTYSNNDDLSLLFPQMVEEKDLPKLEYPSAMLNDDGSAVIRVIQESDENGIALSNDDNIDVDAVVEDDGVWRARWLLVAAAALYGTNFSVVKLLGDEMPVGISSSLRFGLAALATLPWLVEGFVPNVMNVFDQSKKQLENVNLNVNNDARLMATAYGLEVGLWNSIGYVAQAVGLETTLASKSAFLCSMAVVIVPLLDWAAGKKLLSRQWVGALMALVGVAFLELGDVDALMANGITTGDALSMVQPFTFGLGFWRMEQAMHRHPKEARRMTAAQLMAIFISSAAYGLWTLGVFDFGDGGIASASLAGLESSLSTISTSFPWKEWFTDPTILFSLFWTGCITTALTIYMETLALESLSAAETTLIFSTEPLWGTAFAVAVMGEQMGLNAGVGAGLILTACLYSNLGVDGLQDMWIATKKSTNIMFANINNNNKSGN